MTYDEMEDCPNPADERAEAWEFWHERSSKFEAESHRLRAALHVIATQEPMSANTKPLSFRQWAKLIAKAALNIQQTNGHSGGSSDADRF